MVCGFLTFLSSNVSPRLSLEREEQFNATLGRFESTILYIVHSVKGSNRYIGKQVCRLHI
jgi:hypothetical protein